MTCNECGAPTKPELATFGSRIVCSYDSFHDIYGFDDDDDYDDDYVDWDEQERYAERRYNELLDKALDEVMT